jgi:DNA-binding transcriptional regulator GbsR (MarR family)
MSTVDVEAKRPSLGKPSISRKASIMKDIHDQVLYDDDYVALEETIKNEPPPQPRTVREEFFNLNQGLVSIFWQVEHHYEESQKSINTIGETLDKVVKKVDELEDMDIADVIDEKIDSLTEKMEYLEQIRNVVDEIGTKIEKQTEKVNEIEKTLKTLAAYQTLETLRHDIEMVWGSLHRRELSSKLEDE